jgi:hypothetical protein
MVDGRSLDLLSLLLGGSRGDSRPIFEDRSHPTEVMCDVWLGLVLKLELSLLHRYGATSRL